MIYHITQNGRALSRKGLTNSEVLSLKGKEVCVVRDFICERGILRCSDSHYYLTDGRRNIKVRFTFQDIRSITTVDKNYPTIDLNPS